MKSCLKKGLKNSKQSKARSSVMCAGGAGFNPYTPYGVLLHVVGYEKLVKKVSGYTAANQSKVRQILNPRHFWPHSCNLTAASAQNTQHTLPFACCRSTHCLPQSAARNSPASGSIVHTKLSAHGSNSLVTETKDKARYGGDARL